MTEGETAIPKRGTMYIGHIPHGFYDTQIRDYFTQFGTVTRVRLARSKKTGGYKGYGYVQFAEEIVAKIAAEAMNNYMMFDRLLKCQFIPEDKLHPSVWKGANKVCSPVYKVPPHRLPRHFPTFSDISLRSENVGNLSDYVG